MQAVSVDEALLDVSKRVDNGDHDKAVELAYSIRNKVRQSTNCEGELLNVNNLLIFLMFIVIYSIRWNWI